MTLRWIVVVSAMAVGRGPVAWPEEPDDLALARELLSKAREREALIEDIHGEYLQASYLGPAGRVYAPGPPPADLAPGVEWVPNRNDWPERGLALVRFVATRDRLRHDSAVLQPGKHTGTIRFNEYMIRSGRQLLEVVGPDGDTTNQGDRVRTLTIHDGTHTTHYTNTHMSASVSPQRWRGTVATSPFVGSAVLLGKHSAQTLCEGLTGWLATEFGDDDTVDVVRRELDFREEYEIRVHRQTDHSVSDLSVTIVPGWGHAIARYEDKLSVNRGPAAPPSGSGDLLLGEDFREVAEDIWLPFRTIRERFVYGRNQPGPPWQETVEVSFLDLRVNQGVDECEFVFIPPAGVLVSPSTGVAGYPREELQKAFERRREAGFRLRGFAEEPVPTAERYLNVAK